ncbi:MAG: hypothetical protein ABI663_02220 [Chryseolinea sp.]
MAITFFCFTHFSGNATNQHDSTTVESDTFSIHSSSIVLDTVVHRQFDKAKVEKLKNDDELTYSLDKATVSLWDRFWRWVGRALSDLFTETRDASWGRFVVYAGMTVLLMYVIFRLLKIDALKMFYGRADSSSIKYTVLEENIHEMNFEKLIEEAKSSNDYRLAIRLIFLYSLKMLSDKHHIYWEPGKTNHDYLNEVQTKELKSGLRELNYYFEYAWYGNFTVNASLFTTVNDTFSIWRTKI